MSEWKNGTPRELIADLRPGGWAFGNSGRFPQLLSLSKTDLISDLRKLPADHVCTWKLNNPENIGRYAKPRRHVVVWLGK